jgi:hypothetical protein
MSDSEGEYEHEGPWGGHTPAYDTEEHDLMRLLAETFSPALAASQLPALWWLSVSTSLRHVARIKKYSTLDTLSYQGKKWVGTADGEWKHQEYELLSSRYVRGDFGSGPQAWWAFHWEIQGGVG